MKSAAVYKCKDVNALLSKYQDNELAPAAREKIDAHLIKWDTCQQELALLEQVTARVKQLPEAETAPNFTPLVMAKVNQKQEEKSRWFGWLRPPSLVYSFIFIIFLGLGFLANDRLTDSLQHLNGDARQHQYGQEVYMTQLLTESQNLGLINIQDKTMELLINNTGNGE